MSIITVKTRKNQVIFFRRQRIVYIVQHTDVVYENGEAETIQKYNAAQTRNLQVIRPALYRREVEKIVKMILTNK